MSVLSDRNDEICEAVRQYLEMVGSATKSQIVTHVVQKTGYPHRTVTPVFLKMPDEGLVCVDSSRNWNNLAVPTSRSMNGNRYSLPKEE